MQNTKKRIFSNYEENNPISYTNFSYSLDTTACGLEPSVFLYKNSESNSFFNATIISTTSDFLNYPPEGYYACYDDIENTIISRYWNGFEFVGSPEICA